MAEIFSDAQWRIIRRLMQCICELENSGGGSVVVDNSQGDGIVDLNGNGSTATPLYNTFNGVNIDNASGDGTAELHGNGSTAQPLYVNAVIPAAANIYSIDGTLATNRIVTLGGKLLTFSGTSGSEVDMTINAADTAHTMNFKVRGGGGNSGVMLMSEGGSAGFSAGQYNFRILNAGNPNSQVAISGGGTFIVTDQDEINLVRGSGTNYAQVVSNPSSSTGLYVQDINGAVTNGIRLDSSTSSSLYRSLNASSETNITLTPSSFIVNRVVSAVTTALFKVDIGAQTVVLPTILNAAALKTDGTGVISAITPMTAIADATDSTDVVTKFNTLLAELRTLGLLAT